MNQLVTFQDMLPTVQWNEQLIQMVLQQTKKDFALQGYAIDAQTADVPAFLTELLDQLRVFVNQDIHGLSNMLYRVDIPESQVTIALSDSEEDAENILLRLVIERELEKVNWRLKWDRKS
jgi:hypothetical protein